MLGGEALHLQALGGLEEAVERLLRDVHLALVHELEQRGHVLGGGGLQDDAAVAVDGRRLEEVGKVFRAGRQDQLVRLEYRAWRRGERERVTIEG